MKRSRQDKTVAEKLELLNRYKALPSVSQRKAAESLGVSRGFLQNLLKNEAALRSEDRNLGATKRKRVGKDEEVENALFAWFKFACNRNGPVNGTILMHKANDIAQAAGHEAFKATDGWFSRWKKRYGLTCSALKGEADIGGAEKFRRTTMQDILKIYSPENIYSAEETAICFRALPESTYVEKAKKNSQNGFKTAKDRVTLLVTCNMNGDKEQLLLIGKSKSPRCFKNVKDLPIPYNFSADAWMTRTIFEQWLTSWDRRLERAGRKVALLVDNCSVHNSISGLKNISLHVLPPNTTSILQPCDMGIIRALKAYFRREMHHKIIDAVDDSENELAVQTVVKRIHLLDAMHMIKEAWVKISSDAIRSCWRKGGFVADESTEEAVIHLPPPPVGLNVEQFEKWITIDDGVEVVEELTEEQLVEGLVSKIRDKDHDSDDDDELEEAAPSAAEMRECLRRLASGLERTAFKDIDMFYSMKRKIDDHLIKTFPPKQTSLFQFFLHLAHHS